MTKRISELEALTEVILKKSRLIADNFCDHADFYIQAVDRNKVSAERKSELEQLDVQYSKFLDNMTWMREKGNFLIRQVPSVTKEGKARRVAALLQCFAHTLELLYNATPTVEKYVGINYWLRAIPKLAYSFAKDGELEQEQFEKLMLEAM